MTDRIQEAQNYTDPDHNTEYCIYLYDCQPVLTFAFQILVQKKMQNWLNKMSVTGTELCD